MGDREHHRFQAEGGLREAMRSPQTDDAMSVVLALGAVAHALLALSAPDCEAERHWREHVVVDARGNSVPVRDISGCLYCDALTGRFAARRKGGVPDDR